jgi:exodeoxyribonuclease III
LQGDAVRFILRAIKAQRSRQADTRGVRGASPLGNGALRARSLHCGVARDERDVANPAAWEETVLFHSTSRAALEELLSWGLVDVHRQQHPEGRLYSWWDYRMFAFPKNDGLRLDYIFATAPLAARCASAEIDREERKGEKPSDHAPLIAVLDDG